MATAQPSIMPQLAVIAAVVGAAACSSHAPSPRRPDVPLVVVPVQPPGTGEPREVASFRCDEQAVGKTTRVEFRVQSAARDGSPAAQTRAVYTITAQAEQAHHIARAEIVLESLSTDGPGQAQSAWTLGLDAGWIHLRRPFEIRREGSAWCLASACEDATRHEFARAIGDTAELVALPELTEQLTRSADSARITLPFVLVKRMGLGAIAPDDMSRQARRLGRDFPARFVVERGSPDAGSPEHAEPSAREGTGTQPSARAELLVSRSCRLQALKVELFRNGVAAGAGIHRFSWSFDPLP